MRNWKQFVIDRLKERSTWIALGFVASACGLKWAKELDWEQASNIGLFVAAFIQMAWPDPK